LFKPESSAAERREVEEYLKAQTLTMYRARPDVECALEMDVEREFKLLALRHRVQVPEVLYGPLTDCLKQYSCIETVYGKLTSEEEELLRKLDDAAKPLPQPPREVLDRLNARSASAYEKIRKIQN
jgi:hypothetical protein